MINKGKNFGNNANRKKVNGIEDKRYSKAKFKKENGSMTLAEKKEEKPEKKVSEVHNNAYYRQKYETEATRNNKSAIGNVQSVTTMLLTAPSLQVKGYSVLGKGQCVTVTTFTDNPYRKVEAVDGRIGIIPTESGAKPMSFKNV